MDILQSLAFDGAGKKTTPRGPAGRTTTLTAEKAGRGERGDSRSPSHGTAVSHGTAPPDESEDAPPAEKAGVRFGRTETRDIAGPGVDGVVSTGARIKKAGDSSSSSPGGAKKGAAPAPSPGAGSPETFLCPPEGKRGPALHERHREGEVPLARQVILRDDIVPLHLKPGYAVRKTLTVSGEKELSVAKSSSGVGTVPAPKPTGMGWSFVGRFLF